MSLCRFGAQILEATAVVCRFGVGRCAGYPHIKNRTVVSSHCAWCTHNGSPAVVSGFSGVAAKRGAYIFGVPMYL